MNVLLRAFTPEACVSVLKSFTECAVIAHSEPVESPCEECYG